MQRTGGDIHVLPPGLSQEVRVYHNGSLAVMQWAAYGASGECEPPRPVAMPEQRAKPADEEKTNEA
jgi:hypothetical protein